MRHAPGQLADGLQLLRLEERLPRFLQLLGRVLALGDVPRDLGKSDVLALGVPNRINDHAGPEPGPILANPPAFGLELAGRSRLFESPLRNSLSTLLWRVEVREVLADDL